MVRPQHGRDVPSLGGNCFFSLHLLTEIGVIFSSPLADQGEGKFIHYGTDRLIIQSVQKLGLSVYVLIMY